MKVQITDWKLLAKIVWKLELWYQDNYRKLNNFRRKQMRIKINALTDDLDKLRNGKNEVNK
jgi:hypothetical protein